MKLCLFCVLLSAYLLVYIDAPEVIDEKAILATSISIVQHGGFDMDEIAAGNDLVTTAGQLGSRGNDGALYAKKGPVTSLALLPLVFLAEKLPWLPVQATAMLFNALVTALTAVILYNIVLQLGYRLRTAFVVGLIYGLGTLAFTYTVTLFGEPLSGLLIASVTFFACRFRQTGRMRDSLICGVMLALAIGSNAIYVALVPIAAIAILWNKPSRALRSLLWFGLPLLACAALLGLYNLLRFGNPLDTGYHFGQGEGFSYPFLVGFPALLISPYRGLFWYNPVLLLAIPGWLMLRKASAAGARIAWISLAMVIAQVALFASWWAWDGGLGWGPRFLLPALPLMALWLAPLIEAAWTKLWLGVTVAGFSVLSLVAQLLGALYSVFTYAYYVTVYHPAIINRSTSSAADLYTMAASPIVTNAALALAGREMVPVWLVGGIHWIHVAACGLILLAGLASLAIARLAAGRHWIATVTPIAIVAVVIVSLNVILAQRHDQASMQDIQAMDEALRGRNVTLIASTLFDNTVLDLKNGGHIISMNAPTAPDDPKALATWNRALAMGSRFAYVTWFGPSDPANWQEQWLWESAFFVRESNAEKHRILAFNLKTSAREPAEGVHSRWEFGTGVQLMGYGYHVIKDRVYVSLNWSGPARFFIHLVDGDGKIASQQDRVTWGGYKFLGIPDRLVLTGPAGTDPHTWRLRIGVVDPTNGQSVTVTDETGAIQTEKWIMLPLMG